MFLKKVFVTVVTVCAMFAASSGQAFAAESAPSQLKESNRAKIFYTDDQNYYKDGSGTAHDEREKGLRRLRESEEREAAREAQLAEYFSEDDVVMLAQLIDIEAGAVYPLNRRAAVAWTVLNRIDNGRYGPTTVYGVVTQPNQYAWYSGRSYSDMNYRIAKDVLTRWADEKISGQTNGGRVLAQNFENFYGDGEQNHFYDANSNYWDFSVANDPYQGW